MKSMKIVLFIIVQMIALNAFAVESIIVKVSNLNGTVEATDGLKIKSISLSLAVNQFLFTPSKKISTKSIISRDGLTASFNSKGGSFKKTLWGYSPGNRIACIVSINIEVKTKEGKTLKSSKHIAEDKVSDLSECQDPEPLTAMAQRTLDLGALVLKVGTMTSGKEYLSIE